jgi:hypothetical protein
LRNNNDYFNQIIGNPDLKPSFANSISISHNGYNFIKDIYSYESFYVRATSNQITYNRTTYLDSGKTVSQPINTNGNISMNFYGGTGFKIKKLDTRIYFGPQFSYNKNAEVINGKQSFAKTFTPSFNFGVSKSKEKKYDFDIRNNISYNTNTTSQNNTKIHFITNTVNVDGTIYIKKVWSIVSDYQFDYRQKTQQISTALNTHILNARLQRTFKKDEFTAYITVRDILNQNVGIDRNFYSNTYSEVINDRLKRYFLVGFTWDFKNKSSVKPPVTK